MSQIFPVYSPKISSMTEKYVFYATDDRTYELYLYTKDSQGVYTLNTLKDVLDVDDKYTSFSVNAVLDDYVYCYGFYADAENPSLTDGYYNSSFTNIGTSGINVSNLIPCVSGDVVYINNYPGSTRRYMYLYDATQALIERVDLPESGVAIENENAAYFAVDLRSGSAYL